MIDNNHNGNIVLFLYPTPNVLSEPSELYKNAGFINCSIPYIPKNKIIDINVVLFLANVLNIYIIVFIIFDIIKKLNLLY